MTPRTRAPGKKVNKRSKNKIAKSSCITKENGMANLVLKAGKERSFIRRHPWVYATAVAKLQGNATSGDTVEVLSSNGDWLARAAYSPNSQLRARVWTFNQEERIDRTFFEHRLNAAFARRNYLKPRSNALRMVFGEADGLPGLVIDQYADWLVVQLMSAGVEFWKATIFDVLAQVTGCKNIYERSDAAVRAREGLEEITGAVADADTPAQTDNSGAGKVSITASAVSDSKQVKITEDDIHYAIDIEHGHKTGFYVDQRDNRRLVRQLCERISLQNQTNEQASCTVLNCFSYTGGFSLAARAGGASTVTSVDSSAEALRQAQYNASLNGFDDERFICAEANVFDYLKLCQADPEARFDIVILDPPKFAPSANHVERAARAYKDLNMRGLKLLKPNGYLLTFSCSGAISVDLFQKIVAGAVIDAKVDCQLEQRLAAGGDHPMAMVHPEGEYLKGLLLRRC
jgi:23S rRNA (cytosine1962-C5)-methyltransferase